MRRREPVELVVDADAERIVGVRLRAAARAVRRAQPRSAPRRAVRQRRSRPQQDGRERVAERVQHPVRQPHRRPAARARHDPQHGAVPRHARAASRGRRARARPGADVRATRAQRARSVSGRWCSTPIDITRSNVAGVERQRARRRPARVSTSAGRLRAGDVDRVADVDRDDLAPRAARPAWRGVRSRSPTSSTSRPASASGVERLQVVEEVLPPTPGAARRSAPTRRRTSSRSPSLTARSRVGGDVRPSARCLPSTGYVGAAAATQRSAVGRPGASGDLHSRHRSRLTRGSVCASRRGPRSELTTSAIAAPR